MDKKESKTGVRHYYKQKVREVWLQSPDLKQWARKYPGDNTKVYCNNCNCSITAKLHDLRHHAKTQKHLRATEKSSNEKVEDAAAGLLKTVQAESDSSSHHERTNEEHEEMILNEAEGIFETVNTRTKNYNANRRSMDPLHRDLSTSPLRINDSITSLHDDESEVFARAWALSFRRLSEDQKLYAKRCIDEIMVLGRLNALELDTVYALRKK